MKKKLWITPAELRSLWITPRTFYRLISQPGVCTLAYGEFYRGWNEPRELSRMAAIRASYAARVATSIRLHHPSAQLSRTLTNFARASFLEIIQLEESPKKKLPIGKYQTQTAESMTILPIDSNFPALSLFFPTISFRRCLNQWWTNCRADFARERERRKTSRDARAKVFFPTVCASSQGCPARCASCRYVSQCSSDDVIGVHERHLNERSFRSARTYAAELVLNALDCVNGHSTIDARRVDARSARSEDEKSRVGDFYVVVAFEATTSIWIWRLSVHRHQRFFWTDNLTNLDWLFVSNIQSIHSWRRNWKNFEYFL